MKASDYTIVGDRAIHMVGETVAVVRNVTTLMTESNLNNGFTHTVTQEIIIGCPPYIDFVWLRNDERIGELYENDDIPVTGGIDPEFAKALASELRAAVKFIAGGG